MARLIDLTLPLSAAIPTFPGDPRVEVEPVERISNGAPYNLTRISCGTHAGTHVDAPFHFEPGGAAVDRLPLDALIGRARVVDLSGRTRVERADVATCDGTSAPRVLLRTRTSPPPHQGRIERDFAYLTPDAARHLATSGVRLVGIDTPSVERFGSSDFAAHHTLLQAGVVIVEGLDLSQATPGEYELFCLPLLLAGADGAPARAVLRTLS